MPLELFHEFRERQGCPFIINANGVRVFVNGATSDGDLRHLDPPSDPKELAAIRLQFFKPKLEAEERAFSNFRQSVVDMAEFKDKYPNSNVPGPPPDADAQLKQGAARISGLKQRVRQLERIIRDNVPSADDVRHAHAKEEQQKAKELLGKIARIRS